MKKLKLIVILVAALNVSFAGFNRENKEYSSMAIVDVRSTGATGDGVTDDTGAIQAAIDQVAGTGGTVLVPAGTYMINVVTALNLKSNMTMQMESGAILKAIPCNIAHITNIIKISGISNVKVVGGTLIGERYGHIGTTGEFGMAIGLYGGHNVVIDGVTAKDCWGDGFFVGYSSTNVTLSSVVADNNRRQGLSIVYVDGMVVQNSVFKNTNGTAPMAGIDVEPDAGGTVNNVQILNSEFFGNATLGIMVTMLNGTITNVTIDGNNVHNNNSNGIALSTGISGIIVSNNTVYENTGNGIAVWTNVAGNTIRNNIVYANTVHGIVIANNSNNNTITGNVATNNNNRGIVLYNSSGSSYTETTGNTVTGNTATGNPAGNISDLVTPAGSNTVSGNITSGDLSSTINFSAYTELTTGTGPNGIATSDFDGDGKPDLVTANNSGNNLSVFLNTTSGSNITFATVTPDPTTGAGPINIVIGDLDGDGKPDLAVANNTNSVTGNSVTVFLNTSTGPGNIGFAAKGPYTTNVGAAPGLSPWGIAIGDLDRDGKPDLATANLTSGNVSVFLNTSTGAGNIGFAAAVSFPAATNAHGIAIGDIDKDGLPDLATSNATATIGTTVSVLKNTSSGLGNINFTTAATLTTATAPLNIAIGDIDGDTWPDLVTANNNTGNVSVFRNKITTIGLIDATRFAAKVDFASNSNPRSVSISDINGDGKPDLSVANNNSTGYVSVLRNTGSSGSISTGSFAAFVSFEVGSGTGILTVGDFDRDGSSDLASARSSSGTVNKVSVLRNILTGKTWTGGTSTDWNTSSNWSGSAVPSASTAVTIPSGTTYSPVVNQSSGTPAVCSTLTIAPGATLTIAPAKALTVGGLLTNNATSASLVIQSDATGTGSLIAGSVSGSATAQRWMTAGRWQMVSSPLAGQTVAAFLTTNTNIPTYNGSRGMMDYNPESNTWNSFFTTGTGSLTASRGFSMRVGASNAAVTFTGTLQAGLAPVTGLSPDSWNCIGNPYTSAIGINSNSTSTTKFITVNAVDAANIDPNYGAVYVWDKTDARNGQAGNYTAVSNASAAFEVQQGQSYFIKMNTAATTINFTAAMQIHNGGLALKSAEIPWPTIKLAARVGAQSSETVIAFNSAMTNGLDPSYDAGLFRGGSDLIVYSRLVEDNGIPFAIQALPDNSYNSLVIPIGIDFRTGGEVVFSAQLLNLPTECKVILEDKVTQTFTDLSQNTYTISLQANSVITDRFQIHTSYLTTGINPMDAGNLSAYAIRNVQINVNGDVSKNAVATLYDIQGRVVQVTNLDGGNSNIIRTPNLKTGIYLLFVKDNQKVQRFKLAVNE